MEQVGRVELPAYRLDLRIVPACAGRQKGWSQGVPSISQTCVGKSFAQGAPFSFILSTVLPHIAVSGKTVLCVCLGVCMYV